MPEIGRSFSNRDHTTVIHSVKTIERLRQEDKELNSNIDNLKNKGIFANELKPNKYRNHDEELRKVYRVYQEELLRINCVDFGDLILLCIKLFKENFKEDSKSISERLGN